MRTNRTRKADRSPLVQRFATLCAQGAPVQETQEAFDAVAQSIAQRFASTLGPNTQHPTPNTADEGGRS